MRMGELSAALGVSPDVLRRLAAVGIIPGKRLPVRGAHWRFSPSSLEAIRKVLADAGVIEDDGTNPKIQQSDK